MADNAGPFAQMRAWLATRGGVRPRVLRPTPVGPYSDNHTQGAVVAGAAMRNEPDAGLHLVNALVADARQVGRGATADLVKIDYSAYGRPGRHHLAYSRDTATGDDVAMGTVRNTGRRTVIAARPSAPTNPQPATTTGQPWQGADWRTAPAGALGVAARTEFGSGAAGGDRTRWRIVPPTDATNPAPGGG